MLNEVLKELLCLKSLPCCQDAAVSRAGCAAVSRARLLLCPGQFQPLLSQSQPFSAQHDRILRSPHATRVWAAKQRWFLESHQPPTPAHHGEIWVLAVCSSTPSFSPALLFCTLLAAVVINSQRELPQGSDYSSPCSWAHVMCYL